jgi:hypothetical protein
LRELESDPGLNKSKTIADLLEQGGIFSPDDDIETIKQKLQKAVPSDKYSELEVKLRRMEKQLSEKDTAEKALSAQVEAERAKRYNAEKERKILSAMSAANITDESKDMVLNFFSSKTKVSETDGKLNIFYEDEEGLNPTVDSYIQSWAKTDKAKPFIKAPVSSGAGITGSNGTGGGKMTAEQIVAMYPGDQNRGLRAKMYKEHGVIA